MRLPIAFVLALTAAPAFAGSATEAVMFFYDPIGNVMDPAVRDRFVDPALTKLNQNDVLAAGGGIGCIDFAMAVDAQDLDEAEVKRTLKLVEEEWKGTTTVTASFRLFPGESASEREIVWTMQKVGDDWKIADIGQAMGAWVLSDFDCTQPL